MNVNLLRELTEARGVSGREDSIRTIVKRELSPFGDISTDALGNVVCLKRGKGERKVMLAAHMDEIGFAVKHIDKDGFLRVHPIGGWDPRQMNAQRVVVEGRKGPLPGLLMYGSKPAHMLTDEEIRQPQKHDSFFVDLGLNAHEAAEHVEIGDSVTMDRPFATIGRMLTSKTMDDRVGVFVMIEAVKSTKSHEVDIYAVATTQEEVGLRGATAAGGAIHPDVAIAIDITLANDLPDIPAQDRITELGKGAAIKVMDSSLICHPKLVEHFRRVATKHSIAHQLELLARGGTDAGGVQRLNGGMPAFTLSIPTRYAHTVNESVCACDVEACITLLAHYLEEAHQGNYSL